MVYWLSTGISFDIACETHKTLKEQEPELFISGQGRRFMLLLSQDDSLSLVEFDQADVLRKMRAEADAKGDRILPALFIKMFGDRYLISNLIGINLPHGFGISDPHDPHPITTWTRLGRKDRDDIQREFDPASGRHKLQHRFTVS